MKANKQDVTLYLVDLCVLLGRAVTKTDLEAIENPEFSIVDIKRTIGGWNNTMKQVRQYLDFDRRGKLIVDEKVTLVAAELQAAEDAAEVAQKLETMAKLNEAAKAADEAAKLKELADKEPK